MTEGTDVTEQEWIECTDLRLMLDFLHGKVSDRKHRLFGVACCRSIGHLLTMPASMRAVEVIELWVDGRASKEEFENARRTSEDAWLSRDEQLPLLNQTATHAVQQLIESRQFEGLRSAALEALAARVMERVGNIGHPSYFFLYERTGARLAERQAIRPVQDAQGRYLGDILRDIFGNPFHPRPPRPESITPLAEQVYQGRWDLIPILGEWLQEHGYWGEGEHCLDPKNHHVKGCWVVDWVTGRE